MRKHPIHVGEMTELLSLRRRTLTADGAGGATEAMAEYGTAWAHVRPLSGDERQSEGRTNASSGYLIVMRYRDDIRDDDVIRWNGLDLNIRFPRRRGGRELYLEIEADAGVPV